MDSFTGSEVNLYPRQSVCLLSLIDLNAHSEQGAFLLLLMWRLGEMLMIFL